MPKGKSGFRRSPRKKVDSPEAEAFIRGAAKKASEAGSSQEDRPTGSSPPLKHSDQRDPGVHAGKTDKILANDRLQAIRALGEEVRGLIELQNRTAEIKLRIAREAGRLLSELPASVPDTERASPAHSQDQVVDELGVTGTEAGLWQAMSDIHDDVFERFLSEVRAYTAELSHEAINRALKDLPLGRREELPSPTPGTIEDRPDSERMDDDFKAALQAMVHAVKKADENNWKTTSKKTALQYLEMLRHMIIIDGLE